MTFNKLSVPALLPVTVALMTPAFLTLPTQAGILKKHPIAAGAAAGLAAHHFAKKGAAGRLAAGRKPNLAERHPMATGLAAAAVAHHKLKK